MIDDLGMTYILLNQDVVEEGELCPVAQIPWDHYKNTGKQWRRALILKTLGKTFSFKLLEPRIRKVWHLKNNYELMDIDKEYVVVRFYYAEDYQKVLTRGPWTVMGHYLTITKWKPNFKPTDIEVQSTLA